MSTLNFPLNPSIGQSYTVPGTTAIYTWNGAAWIKSSQGDQTFGNISGSSASIGTNPQTAVTIDSNGSIQIRNGTLNITNTATIGNLVFFESSLTNTLGNLSFQSPTGTDIVLNNNTLINGNLHATGNITANGSVQIGNQTGSDTLSLFADIVSDIIPKNANQYNIGTQDQTWQTGYFENVVANNFVTPPGQPMNIGSHLPQDINIRPVTNPLVNINGPIRVWGDSPLGTAPVVSNILYVSMDGDDTNDGRAADASRACRTISGAIRSPYYKEGTSIKVAPGHYYENNPIELKPYTSVIGSDLRTTSIEPINKTQDLFHVQSGCYLNYMQFTNGQSGLLPGSGYNDHSNRGAYATSFPPNYGGTKIDVFHSPYIQNCTNQSGPWLYDGTMFQPNQTVQVPDAVGTATWALNTTTMIVHASEGTIAVGQSINVGPTPIDYVNARTLLLANKEFIQEQVIAYVDQNNTYYEYDKTTCIRDTGLIIDSLISDLLFEGNGFTQSNFAGLQYWNQAGYTGSISEELTTTTSAINYVSSIAQQIIQNDIVTLNQSTVSQDTSMSPSSNVEVQYISTEFSLITNILNNGTSNVTDAIVPNGTTKTSTTAENAVNVLQTNKSFIQAQAVAFVEANKSNSFTYDQKKCYRDIGYMIDCVCFDLLYGGNRQAIQAGVYYYGFSGTASAIPTERPQTTAAYYRIREILNQLLTNQSIVRSPGNLTAQVTNLPAATSAEVALLKLMIEKITEIINGGSDAADTPSPITLSKSNNPNVSNAANILKANKGFIASEVISYINAEYNNGFVFNQPKCSRDTGLIVDSIAVDLLYGGSTQSTFAGLQYWNQKGYTGSILGELTTTSNAIKYVSNLAQQVLSNTTGTRYQSTVTQVIINTQTATLSEINTVSKEFALIDSIILNGTTGVTDIIVSNGAASMSSNIINAYALLQANKSFIQTEAIAYVDSFNSTFNHDKCYRDIGYMIDSVSFDLLHGGNRQAVQSGVYYYTFDTTSTSIPNEIPQTVAAYDHIRNIVGKIITGAIVNPTAGNTATQITNLPVATSVESVSVYSKIDVITNIINHGPSVASSATSISLTPTQDSNVIAAYNLIMANKEFIQAETIAYVSQFSQGFVYNRAKCKRDVGILVENIAYDIAFGGNQKSVESGLAYWSGVTSVIPGEITTTTNAIQYIGTLAQDIIANVTTTNLLSAYQTAPQVINTALVNGNSAGTLVTKLVNLINDIVANGTEVAPYSQAGNGPDWGSVSAEVLLQTNRKFIQNEVVNWVNNTFPNFVYNEALCYRDTGLIIDAISQDIILNSNTKSIEAATAYWTGNTNAVANEVTETIAAINRAKQISLQIINNSTVTSTSFVFNPTKCSRDTGLIVDALAQDLLFNGNSQSTFAGIQYWNHSDYVGDIASQISTTTAAINHLKSISQQILLNNTSGERYQTTVRQSIDLPAATSLEVSAVGIDFDVILNILTTGTAGVTDSIVPNSIVPSSNTAIRHGYALLQANKQYMQAEVIAYLDTISEAPFDHDKCYRDLGYMIDSVSFDLLYGGNRQAVQSGVYYWGYNSQSTSLPSERVASTNAYYYMKELITEVITATPATLRYQNSIPQTTNLPAATKIEVADVMSNIDLITNIINQGPSVAPAATSISLNRSINQFVNNAANLLAANRDFIRAEVIGYVNNATPRQTFLPFYDKGANATLAVVRNFDIISNIIENGVETAPSEFEGNGIFVKSGLSRDNIAYAPVVTAVTSLGGNVYKIDISESTIGQGDNQTLYFGTTSVYPLLDLDVPDRWQQRRLNPIGSMGGSLVDGAVVSDRSPITSFVYDAFTQVNQGGNGIKVINNGYAQLVSVFTIFCSNAVTVESGGIASITNSNSNFGDISLSAKGYGKREFSGYVKNPPVLPYYTKGVYPQGGELVVYVADPKLRPHIALVMEVEPPTDYINNQGLPGFLSGNIKVGQLTTGTISITNVDTTDVVIGQHFYVKDQYGRTSDSNNQLYVRPGTVVADVSYQTITLNYPLNSGGGDANNANYFNLYTCGNAYYTVLSSTVSQDLVTPGTLLLPDTQGAAEGNAIDYLNSLVQQIIINQAIEPLQTASTQVIDVTLQHGNDAGVYIANELTLIKSILENGPSSAPKINKYGVIPKGTGYADASALLKSNKTFIQDEIVQYVNNSYPELVYDQTKCCRDVGLLVDALIYDLEKGGNYNAIIAGKSYYAEHGTHHLVQLEENVTDPLLFPDGAIINFYQRSYISASGYLFEYVGAGTNYGALPQVGVADPVQSKETVQLNNGKVFFTSTDQNGDFRIGTGLVISQATGVLSGRTFTKSLFANLTPFILAIEGI